MIRDVTVDYTGWYRVGGHRLQFYATDEEIVEWLAETLPAELAPYDLVGQIGVTVAGFLFRCRWRNSGLQ